jgi:hypothetical protein
MKTFTFVLALLGAVSAQSCCPNGVYTGNIADACGSNNNGDGQCYDNFQIRCTGGYLSSNIRKGYLNDGPVDIELCLDFCYNTYYTALTAVSVTNSGGPGLSAGEGMEAF